MKELRTDIYLGIKRKDGLKDQINLSQVYDQLTALYSQYQIGFSLNQMVGGYLHYDGSYITENSVRITLIGDIEEQDLSNDIEIVKMVMNQETILVVQQYVDVQYS